ncbi:hypothetical protein ACFL1E_07795 [Candidatus Omnitrophota bacterium]
MVRRAGIKAAALIVIVVGMMSLSIRPVSAQEEDSGYVPAPKGSIPGKAHNVELGDIVLETMSYSCEENRYDVAAFYKAFFREQGFQETLDQVMSAGIDIDTLFKEQKMAFLISENSRDFKAAVERVREIGEETKSRRLQYKKQQQVVDVLLAPSDIGTDIAIAKYVLPKESSRLEDAVLSIGALFKLPKRDAGGEDLAVVPRPPESVRLGTLPFGRQTYVTYSTKLSILEAVEFYRDAMPYEGWELTKEIDMGKVMQTYRKMTGKRMKVGALRIPLRGAARLDLSLRTTFVLEFTGRYGSAEITIMPSIIAGNPDSMVQIIYSEGDAG